MQEFELFGAQHLVALLLVGVFSVLSFRLGKTKLANFLAKLGAAVLGGYGVWLWSLKLQNGFQAELDLPLALCDLIFIFCLLAFIRPYPLLVTLVTYWGLAGTLQALITPDVERAFPSAEFTLFFLGHSVIIFAVVFLLGWAPHERLAGWSGIKVSFSYLLLYTFVVGSLDLIFDLNYGYILRKPAGASILDLFGPWPVYVFLALVIALILFAVVALMLKLVPGASPVEGEVSL